MRIPKIHKLKVWLSYYPAIESGEKTFELRKNDRDFKINDYLNLQPFDEHKNEEVQIGRHLAKITYILKDCSVLGLQDGFVILGLKPWKDMSYEERLVFRLVECKAIDDKTWQS